VDLPTALLRDLLHLSSSVFVDDHALKAPLLALVHGLSAAISSYRGLQLTIVENGQPVSLTTFISRQDGESITTSLRVPLPALGAGFDPQSRIVFYAATPGALVDLAADFGYALDTPTITASIPAASPPSGADPTGAGRHDGHDGHGRHDGPWMILLDADLPPPTPTSGLTGLHELSTINRAVGTLIEQGHQPNQAHASIRRHAAAGGLEPHIYAEQLLRR
jgi:hypothetical protein